MLDGVPVYAVLSENLGQRGAHRVAYEDYLNMKGQQKESSACVVARSSDSTPESASDRWFRRIGYFAAGYLATRVVMALLPGEG